MPLANRVTPQGRLEADPARGLLFGNRGGRFHDPVTRTVKGRPWATKQWISCALDFKDRTRSFRAAGRKVWSTRFTELFFCDEVTALAAGHRPCTECRRAASLSYRDALLAAGVFAARPSCPDLDVLLDAERRDGQVKRLHAARLESLPDGAMVLIDDTPFALRGDKLLRWSHAGYVWARSRGQGKVALLTPPTSLAALRGGFEPIWHGSAETYRQD